MSFSSVRSRIPATVVAAALLCGCGTPQIPVMSQPHDAVIAVDIVLKQPLGDVRSKPNTVYFAKIDSDDGLLQKQIIRANYVKDSRAYLLNAVPGTYVVVAAYLNPPMLVTSTDSITYFSKEIVERSKTTVGEGELAFMGSFEVAQAGWLDQADEVQTHYRNVLSPKDPKGIIAEYLNKLTSYRGQSIASGDEDKARDNFVRNAKKDLVGSSWATLLN